MDRRVNLFMRDKGLHRLVLQFISGDDIEIVTLKDLKDYTKGIVLLGFECITFWNVLTILGNGINNIILIKSQAASFKWYNSFVLPRYKAIITTPFSRRDFQRAMTYVFSIERRK